MIESQLELLYRIELGGNYGILFGSHGLSTFPPGDLNVEWWLLGVLILSGFWLLDKKIDALN